jgi:hypothetical protein
MAIGGLAGESPSRRLAPGFEGDRHAHFEDQVTILPLADLPPRLIWRELPTTTLVMASSPAGLLPD